MSPIKVRIASILAVLLLPAAIGSAQCISLTSIGGAYTQNFDTLANTGTSSVVPAGWAFNESGTNANATYTAGTGSSNAGDTYSFGAAGSTERAFGTLQSGSLIPSIGACFTNNTGSAIGRLGIAYTGEQWRLGQANRNAADRLDFQYSTDASSLSSGAWSDVATLSFSGPVITGDATALDGNAAANRSAINGAVVGLAIPNGATFWIRWTDFNASGSDDGLAVDDFSLTPLVESGLTVSDSSVIEGDAGVTLANVVVSLTAAASGDVTFDIATADGTALAAGSDYVAKSLTGQTISAGQTTYTFAVQVNGDTIFEPNETFRVVVSNVVGTTVLKSTATVTILNDDSIPISLVQGPGNTSPLAGQAVAVKGIVTGVKSNGFFIQTPDGLADSDPLTSEGIFVFTSSAPPAAAKVGNLVLVTGTASEFQPEANSPTATEISGSPSVTLISTGNALPTPVTLTAADTTAGGGLFQLEKYEGMRVRVNSLTVVAPTDGTINETTATSTSDGVFYGVITGVARPFREPGIETPDPRPAGSPCCVPVWDSNPERIRVDSDGLTGAAKIDVTTGEVVTNLVGPLDYAFRTYTILPDPGAPPTVTGNISAIPVPAATANQFTIATMNMERFFDTVNDPTIDDVALTPAAFDNRLAKASMIVRNILRLPDILAVQEMENLPTLQAVATRINQDVAASGAASPAYTAHLVEGNDIGGIDVGFLVKSTRVNVVNVVQEGKDTTYTPPGAAPEILNDRPPLILDATISGPSGAPPFPITVIANHLRSLNGVDDPVDGPRVRAKRRAQAEFLANLIQARQAANPSLRMVVLGDFNAFEFNDGYVDMTGTIQGAPTAADNVVLASGDMVNPNLVNAADSVAPAQRYSYVFDGSAQTLDQFLFTQNLQPYFGGLEHGRVNADFPEVYRNDPTRPERLSDHDPAVGYFRFPGADLGLGVTSAPAPVTGKLVTYTLNVTNTMPDAARNVVLSTSIPAGLASFAFLVKLSGWTCTTPPPGTPGDVRCTNPSLAAGANDSILLGVTVDYPVANGTLLPVTARVSSDTFDPDTSNNSRTVITTVSSPLPAVTGVLDKPL